MFCLHEKRICALPSWFFSSNTIRTWVEDKGVCTYCALDESRKRVEHMRLGESRESIDKGRIIPRECGCENNRGVGAHDNTISCTHTCTLWPRIPEAMVMQHDHLEST